MALTKNGNYFGPQPKPLLNSHTFMVTKEENGAFLGCKSENKNKWHAETWPVELNVLCKLACNSTLVSGDVSMGSIGSADFLVNSIYIHKSLVF